MTSSDTCIHHIIKDESFQYNQHLALYDSYELTCHKIRKFQENTNALVTFIIPSVNRDTLSRTMSSILHQTDPSWNAILLFDGCEPSDPTLLDLLSDSRILFMSIQRRGSTNHPMHGTAGTVRNIGMNLAMTPWIGFVDDDDHLAPYYVSKLREEVETTPSLSTVIFKMVISDKILPPCNYNEITHSLVGISFAIRTSLIENGFLFRQSGSEDFDLLKDIEAARHTIVLSPYITYFVRDVPAHDYLHSYPSSRESINA
jgi:glycosyltransferase involved in cell wall biosynthesis